MKKILVTLLKLVLLFTFVAIIGAVTIGFVTWMKWPWWISLCFLLVYLGLYCIWLVIRKIILRNREKQFVSEVIAQDQKLQKSLNDSDFAVGQELQQRWKEAIAALKKSKLAKSGNPLYVLPWYMVIGESQSGKTTAIQSAGLSGPFAETRKTQGFAGTKNCEWWFFEQAIILDTAGRYTIPLEEGHDRKEWQKFLSLLVKYRKKEALSGLVVTIAADKLLKSSEDVILSDGQNIRQRIDELMRVLEVKIPIYVLVTKCDLIQGMTGFSECLPEKSLNQVMGLLNLELSKDVDDLIDTCWQSILNKLKTLRLLLLSTGTSSQNHDHRPDVLLFPHELSQLKNNFKVFIDAAFKENPYQETPLLRGIYFSSGKQEGAPYSNFLSSLGLIKQQDVMPEINRGLFLHDLFSKVMAADRGLYAPTRKALAWHRLTRNIGLTAWVAIVLSLSGLLSYSFIKNSNTLQTASIAFEKSLSLQGDVLADIPVMERFQKAISSIEKTNEKWWLPRFGLYESQEIEVSAKEKYCTQFKEEFTIEFDKRLALGLSEISTETSDEIMGQYVIHLTDRINLLQARLNGQGVAGLTEMRQPQYQPFISSTGSNLVNEASQRVAAQNLYYLVWQQEENVLQKEMNFMQKQLHDILTLPNASLNWLVAMINQQEENNYIELEHFWGDYLSGHDETTVPPAFTRDGKKMIDLLIQHIENALPNKLAVTSTKERFLVWYTKAYKQVWFDFTRKFSQAEQFLQDREAWKQAASVMAMDNGPYFALINRLNKELVALELNEDDDWIRLLQQFENMRIEANTERAIQENKSLLAKATKKGKKTLSKIEKGLGATDAGSLLESRLIGGEYLNNYRSALSELVLATSSRKVSFQIATDIFKQDSAVSDAAMYVAQRNIINLRKELSALNADKKTRVVWKLVSGPLSFLRDYAFLEASCQLNSLWEEDVLVEAQDIADKTKLNDQFFDENGMAFEFIKGPAGPFLGRNLERGFYPQEALGRKIPFREEFLNFLTEGVRLSKYKPDLRLSGDVPLELRMETMIPSEPTLKDKYTVLIEARATSVNKEAKMIPHAVSLELICKQGVTRLVNLQYPVNKKFIWQPKDCQTLSIKIEVGSLVLEKKYEDEYLFARFINDYKSGSVTYTPLDFPDKQKLLKRLNIRAITVKFKASEGAEPLFSMMQQLEERNKALGISDRKNGQDDEPNVAEILMTLEQQRKADDLQNEAMKKAWKDKQVQRAAEIKQQWEQQLPDVPRDITICWD